MIEIDSHIPIPTYQIKPWSPRKVTIRELTRAWEQYRSGTVSLAALGDELGVTASRMLRLFRSRYGDEYAQIAQQRRRNQG